MEAAQERDWLNRKEAARYMARRGCPISVRTLERWAAKGNRGRGPAFSKMRHHMVRYLKADIDTWIAREVVRIQ